MFGTSGIRGPVGEVVTAELALSVGRALAAETERVVIGRDPRRSGAFLADAVSAGLREGGTDVVRLGLAATPTIARAVSWQEADAGVAVTASHNPPTDNGLKLWQPSGQAFDASRREAIETRLAEGRFTPQPWDLVGNERAWDARERHVEAIVDSTEPVDMSVVLDVGNGAGGVTAEVLLALGCEVETLNAQPDGRFPGRPSEPTEAHCASLCQLVESSGAALGIAHDGDADRTLAVAEDGTWVAGDVLLALFAREAAQQGDRVAVPVDASLAIDDALAEVGATVTRTSVGDVYVAERAAEPDVVFGGEPSGSWIWPEETLCPDGPLAAAKLVALVGRRGPLSELVNSFETYPIHRESLETPDKTTVMERVRDEVLATYDEVSTLDGVRVDLGDAWFLVRASGTQPLVRVTAEARAEARARDIFEEARELVAKAR